jgi:hypothetical protein
MENNQAVVVQLELPQEDKIIKLVVVQPELPQEDKIIKLYNSS